jgi:hypothetical protein
VAPSFAAHESMAAKDADRVRRIAEYPYRTGKEEEVRAAFRFLSSSSVSPTERCRSQLLNFSTLVCRSFRCRCGQS